MRHPTSRWIAVLLMAVSVASAMENAPPPPIIADATGCKLANPFYGGSEPAEIAWTGQCKDGYLEGPGTVTKTRTGESLSGDFSAGRTRRGVLSDRRASYEGELQDNIPDGTGVYRRKDGFVLKASFTKWQSFGRVEVTWPDGSRYEGEFDHQADLMEGQGKLTAVDGSVYEGGFHASLFEGQGTLRLPNGEVRTGTFAHGKLNGEVTVLGANGSKYRGQTVDDLPSGQGVWEYATGGRYEGGFLQGVFHGAGVMRQAGGDVTEATFRAGLPQGRGKQTYANGDVYEGEFVDGKRHGSGRFTTRDGRILEGDWVVGNLSGKCAFTDSEGSYRGTCLAGKRSGTGRAEVTKTGEIYEGEFLDDFPNGTGRLQRKDYVYEGTFKAGLKHGRGKETLRNAEYEGEFRDDLWHGRGRLQMVSKRGDVLYEGMFAAGKFEGNGLLKEGSLQLQGEFRAGGLYRGVLSDGDRKIEVDIEKGEFVEVLPDGSKRSVDKPTLPDANVGI